MCWASRLTCQVDSTPIAEARRHVTDHLTTTSSDLTDTETLADVELIVSEMVTNSVQAAAAAISVVTTLHWDHLRIEVMDDAPGWPARRHVSAEDNSGRGLAIIAALTQDWGVTETADGKNVWVMMRLPEGTRTPSDCQLRAD